jgi:hypothetical protein
VKIVPDIARGLPELASGKRLLARVLSKRDAPEPVAAWRAVPEEQLRALSSEDKVSYVEALLPLARKGKTVRLHNLRRLYQLFTFMEIPAERRIELVSALFTKLRLEPQPLPYFGDKDVRRSLVQEAVVFAGKPDAAAKNYINRLATHLGIEPDQTAKWTQFFEKLTDLENRVATTLGKKGHIVRLDDRKLEIFKKAVASVGVPSAVLFPLGTVGLSIEGITTGLIALGGGFVLPASVAMITGVGVAVALGVTSKKILDMVMPTTDADRASIDLEKLNADAAQIRKALDEAVSAGANEKKLEEVRARIGEIIKGLVPLDAASRAKLEAAVEHTRELGERYVGYLGEDRKALEAQNHVGADDVGKLLALDLPAMR